MRDVERELRKLGELADRDLPGAVGPRPAALKRIRLRRRILSGSVALSVALVVGGGMVIAAGTEGTPPVPPANEERDAEEPIELDERAERCGAPFAATYVPPGFDVDPSPGAGGSSGAPGTPAHFTGGQGRFIDVTVPFAQGFSPTARERIEVLGRHAVLGAIHEGFAVDFDIGRCRYQLLGYGVTRGELRLFAEGLVGTEARVNSWFAAVWPEDTLSAARRGCAGDANRGDPRAVAQRFAREVLRWDDNPGVSVSDSGLADAVDVELWNDVISDEGGKLRAIRLSMREVLPSCWSVVSASPLAEGRFSTLSVGVNGRDANVVFEPWGAKTATVEFGYGPHTSSTIWRRGQEITRLRITQEGNDTGHFLVLLTDSRGTIFTAIGRPLPPGDFAAG